MCCFGQYFFPSSPCLLFIPLSCSQCSQIVWLLFPEFQQELEVTWLVYNSCLKSGTELSSRTSPSLHESAKQATSSSEFILALHDLLMSFETNSSDSSSLGHLSCFFLSSGLRSHPFGKGISYGNCFKREDTETFGCLKILFALH